MEKNKKSILDTLKSKIPIGKKKEPSPKFFSWNQWTEIFSQSVDCWKVIIGPFAGLILLFFVVYLINVSFYTAARDLMLGGPQEFENIIANMQIGTYPETSQIISYLFLTLGWLLISILLLAFTKVGILTLIKKQATKKTLAFGSLFKGEQLKRVGDYFLLGCRILWYLLWPLLLIWGLSTLMLVGLMQNSVSAFTFLSIRFIDWFDAILRVLIVGVVVVRSLRVFFAGAVLVHTKLSVAAAFKKALVLTKDTKIFVCCMWGLFVALLYGLNQILFHAAEVDPIILVSSLNLGLVDLLAFLVNLLIFAPIAASFQYFLMLKVAKNKSVKL